MKVLILAGGSGSRLWPLSTEALPKPFIRLDGKLSLLQKTVLRFAGAPLISDIAIVTHDALASTVHSQLEEMAVQCHVLTEPHKKNTGPAISLGVNFLQTVCKASDQEPILVAPSDHLMEQEPPFLRFVERVQPAVQQGRIVLFGIRPTRPDTGYGYIRIDKPLDDWTYSTHSFIEKPDLARATQFIESPMYYWNAGIFLFTPETFKNELVAHCPALLPVATDPLAKVLKNYDALPTLSIDYALMERSKRIALCPLPLQWSDIGSWESLYEAMEKDPNQNVKIGHIVDIDTKRTLIFAKNQLIVAIGLEDLLIAETDGAILISKRGHSHKVKQIAQKF
jgi:mannose-1-phosphate guanylyltransferase/mannose-6-phosphate isomerase